MEAIYIILIACVMIFIGISLFIFFKRYKEHKDKLEKISIESVGGLKSDIEEEIRKKREDELKRLESGDIKTIREIIDRTFKSSKLSGWVRSQNYKLYNSKNLSLIVNISGKEELVNTKKEIVLKSGEVYTQNKHYLAVKREYSEKVFQCAYKVVEEVFTNIPTLYKIYLSEYINHEETDSPVCVLSLTVSRDQYRTVKDDNKDIKAKLDYFGAIYDYNAKDYDFSEVEPVSTPSGEMSLEKTMASKASSSTVLYGNTVLNPGEEPKQIKNNQQEKKPESIDSNTKISDLNGSVMFDKSMLNIDAFDQKRDENLDKTMILNQNTDTSINESSDFQEILKSFFGRENYKSLKEESLANAYNCILASSPDKKIFLIMVSESTEIIKEESIKILLKKLDTDNIENGIFITNGGFGLDAVSLATANNILLYDKEKLLKSLS